MQRATFKTGDDAATLSGKAVETAEAAFECRFTWLKPGANRNAPNPALIRKGAGCARTRSVRNISREMHRIAVMES